MLKPKEYEPFRHNGIPEKANRRFVYNQQISRNKLKRREKTKIVGGFYNIYTGKVIFYKEHNSLYMASR